MRSKDRCCIVMEESNAVYLQRFDQPESLMFSMMSFLTVMDKHSQISPSLWEEGLESIPSSNPCVDSKGPLKTRKEFCFQRVEQVKNLQWI